MPMKQLLRELIIEACSVLQHDTDIADEKPPEVRECIVALMGDIPAWSYSLA